jgi:predicted nucleic acid-binding protein
MTFLCDTNIISELVRPQPNPGVLIWVKNLSSIKISVITLEEIHYGLTSKPNLKIQNWFDIDTPRSKDHRDRQKNINFILNILSIFGD